MDAITAAPVKNGLVRLIRANAELATALVGGIHQRVAPRKLRFPYAVYSVVSDPVVTDPGGDGNDGHVTIDMLVDISVVSLNTGEAENLDRLLAVLLGGRYADDALQQYVVGQTILRCQRVSGMPTGPVREATGRRTSQFGGTYRIVADVPLTKTV